MIFNDAWITGQGENFEYRGKLSKVKSSCIYKIHCHYKNSVVKSEIWCQRVPIHMKNINKSYTQNRVSSGVS
jgi:hypothetical protein